MSVIRNFNNYIDVITYIRRVIGRKMIWLKIIATNNKD